jgi:hypothetical protein
MDTTLIDIKFDFRTDAKGGDPDKTSPTLRRYHQLLWSKPLPNGRIFALDSRSGRGYLNHKSDLGEFVLASDSVLPIFTNRIRYRHIIEKLPPEEVERFRYITYTIGGMMIFPGNKVNGFMTINGARGFNQKISDRFDLTLECVRRYYIGEASPLYNDLTRYDEFFRLFVDFKGYVNFFLLQDLVVDDCSAVRLFTPFDNFKSSPLPESLADYELFKERTIAFVKSRNNRIADHPQTHRG